MNETDLPPEPDEHYQPDWWQADYLIQQEHYEEEQNREEG